MNIIRRSIIRFMLRTAAIVLPVIAVAVAAYVAADPYMVLHSDADYFPDPATHPARISVNKGMVTLNTYRRQTALGHRYDAFIFGSSISCYYDAVTWAGHLQAADGCRPEPFHFDSSGESLFSMAAKVKWLDASGAPVRHALIVLDPIIMTAGVSHQPYAIDPPELHSGVGHILRWHYTFFRSAVNADFLKSWLPWRLSGLVLNNGHNRLFEPQPIAYDPLRNQETIPLWDSVISVSPQQFYDSYPLTPSPQHTSVSPAVIDGPKHEALADIADILSRHHTDVHVVISPNRRKVTLHPSDLAVLRRLFGTARVHDLTSSMAHRLETDTLLYDDTHYRPVFAAEIMDSIYGAARRK